MAGPRSVVLSFYVKYTGARIAFRRNVISSIFVLTALWPILTMEGDETFKLEMQHIFQGPLLKGESVIFFVMSTNRFQYPV